MPRFTVSEMAGPKSASALSARVEALVSSRFAPANRRTSCSSRPKAFTTRMPPRYSRVTEFTPSSPSCTRRKRGNPVSRLAVMSAAATGTTTASTSESPGSRMTAMTRLPTATMGALAKMRISPFTNAWTWVTSLVCRVMSEAVSNRSSSSNENEVILRKRSARRRAAKRNETRLAMTLRPIAPTAPIARHRRASKPEPQDDGEVAGGHARVDDAGHDGRLQQVADRLHREAGDGREEGEGVPLDVRTGDSRACHCIRPRVRIRSPAGWFTL